MSVISSRDEYLFINPADLPEASSDDDRGPGKIKYGGDIMPLRDADDKTLRGIDPLFIVNRINMMHSLHMGTLIRDLRFSCKLDGKTLSDARKSLVGFVEDGEYYRDWYADSVLLRRIGGLCGDIEPGIYKVEKGWKYPSAIPGMCPQIGWKSSADAFDRGNKLSRKDVENLVEDCNWNNILTWDRYKFSINDVSYSYEGTISDDYGYEEAKKNGSWLFFYRKAHGSSGGKEYSYTRKWTANDVTRTFTINRSWGDVVPIPEDAYPEKVINLTYINAYSANITGIDINKNYWLAAEAEFNGEEYITKQSDFDKAIEYIKNDSGMAEIENNPSQYTWVELYMHRMADVTVLRVNSKYDWKRQQS